MLELYVCTADLIPWFLSVCLYAIAHEPALPPTSHSDTHLVCQQDLLGNSQARKTGSVNNTHALPHKFNTLSSVSFVLIVHPHTLSLTTASDCLCSPPPPRISPSLLVISLLPPTLKLWASRAFGLGNCESAEQQRFNVKVWSSSAVASQSSGPLTHCSINHASSLVWSGDLCGLQHREKWVKKHSRIATPVWKDVGESRFIWLCLNS